MSASEPPEPKRYPLAGAEEWLPRSKVVMQRIESVEDLGAISFSDGLATVLVPFEMLEYIRFKNDTRAESPRLRAVRQSIRRNGYLPRDPIICRIGARGRWIVVDGGHRLTAARQVAAEWWPNLFRPVVGDIYFVLFETVRSWRKLQEHARAYRNPRPWVER